MSFRVNGVSTIITSSGAVGVGTLVPDANIALVSTGANAVISISATGTGKAINVTSGNVFFGGNLNVVGGLVVTGGFQLSGGANTYWHSGNDGAGSGLDADTLDGNNSGVFTNSTNQTVGTLPTGRLTGAYDGITSVGTLDDLNVTTNVSAVAYKTTKEITTQVNVNPAFTVDGNAAYGMIYDTRLPEPAISFLTQNNTVLSVTNNWMYLYTYNTVPGIDFTSVYNNGIPTSNSNSIFYITGVSKPRNSTSHSDRTQWAEIGSWVNSKDGASRSASLMLGVRSANTFNDYQLQISGQRLPTERQSVYINAPLFANTNAGNTSYPAIAFYTDEDTGINRSAVNTLDLIAGGKVMIDIVADSTIAFQNATSFTHGGNVAIDTNVLHVDSVGNKVSIGKLQPNNTLDVVGTINATSDIASATSFRVGANTVWHSGTLAIGANTVWHSGNDGSGSGLDADTLDANNSGFFTNSTNQTVGTLPSGRLSGAYTGIQAVGVLTDLDITGNTTVDTNTLHVDTVGNKVSIGKVQPNSTLDVVGTINATSTIASATGFKVGADTVWHSGNDGSGSGLDADTLDGNNSNFFTDTTNHTTGTTPSGRLTGAYTGITGVGTLADLSITGNTSIDTNVLHVDTVGNKVSIGKVQPNNTLDVVGTINATSTIASATDFKVGANTVWHSGTLAIGANTVWHSGNDGAGSGLDADTLDGNNSGVFTNSTNQTVGTLPSGRLTGAYTGVTQVGTLTDLTVTGNTTIDTDTFFVDSVGGRVGINTASPNTTLHIKHSYTASNPAHYGFLLENANESNAAPGLKIRSRRNTSSGAQTFSGKLLLEKLRTDQYVAASSHLGTIFFGGNHTDGNENNVEFTAAIAAISEVDFTSNSAMSTALVFRTSTVGTNVTSSTTTTGDEQLRIRSNGQAVFASSIVAAGAVSSPSLNEITKINEGPISGFRNLIINPMGQIQNRSSTTTANGNIGIFDRWFYQMSTGVSARTWVPLSNVSYNGLVFPSMMRMWNQAGTNVRQGIGQIIEGDTALGVRGMPLAASVIGQKNSTGQLRIALIEWSGEKDNLDRNIVSDWGNTTYQQGFFFKSGYNVINSSAVTVAAQTMTVVSTIGTPSPNANNLIVFVFGTTVDTGTTGHTDAIIQLTVGNAVPTYFETRPIATERSLCSRYFERIGGTANTYFGGYAEASTVGMVPMTFSEKRTDSVNISSSGAFSIRYTGGNTPVTAITTTEKHKKGALLQLTTTSLTGGQAVMLKSNATTAYIEIDAEI